MKEAKKLTKKEVKERIETIDLMLKNEHILWLMARRSSYELCSSVILQNQIETEDELVVYYLQDVRNKLWKSL